MLMRIIIAGHFMHRSIKKSPNFAIKISIEKIIFRFVLEISRESFFHLCLGFYQGMYRYVAVIIFRFVLETYRYIWYDSIKYEHI